MIQGIDHIVILVEDLATAIEQYRQLGFTVNAGGQHPGGTHNALIGFQDGSYLELIAFWELGHEEHPWHKHLAIGGGVIDYAVGTDDLTAEIAILGQRGVRYDGPHDGARSRPDGVDVAWKMAFRADETASALPFLIEDVTAQEVRVPSGDAAEHANGALGIDRLIIAVTDLDVTAGRYATLLNSDPHPDNAEPFDGTAKAVGVQVSSHRIELHRPGGDGPMSARLNQRGEGPYVVVLYGPEDRDIRPDEASGACMKIAVR